MPITSQASPLSVRTLPQSIVGLPGRLCLTMAPGKKDAEWDRDLSLDLDRLRRDAHADVLVCLLEKHELALLGIGDLLEQARARDMQTLWYPIPDLWIPSSMERTREVVGVILDSLRVGRNVVIHCRGGLGRTGLLASACLVALGLGADEAITVVRSVRPRAVETPEQQDFVYRFAAALRVPAPAPEP